MGYGLSLFNVGENYLGNIHTCKKISTTTSSENWIWVKRKLDPDQLFGTSNSFYYGEDLNSKIQNWWENSKLVGNVPSLFNYTYKFNSKMFLKREKFPGKGSENSFCGTNSSLIPTQSFPISTSE